MSRLIVYLGALWHRAFLEERPSIGLSFFRIAVALTVGFHVIPTLFNLPDNYYHTALKTLNTHFFTAGFLALVQKSPDSVVRVFVVLFYVFWFFFLIGLWSRASCIAMTLTCYYFYALNSFHVGTLSWDILLVTLFLMCLVPYHGDYFSMDALRRKDPQAYKRNRPFFIQRLLQVQIASTYFYTALYKVTAAGNWITGNPIYYLMNEPPAGVTKYFLLRDWFAAHPQACYITGITVVVVEFLMPFLLFVRRTRISAIYLGIFFHIVLLLTLDVPAIFFFLFPAQLLLFIHPDRIIRWVEQKRLVNASAVQGKLVYDGRCGFCQDSVRTLMVMDLFASLNFVDFHRVEHLELLHPQLTRQKCMSQIYLIEPDGELYGGFDVFRRLCFTLPMMYVLIPALYFPGMGVLGPWAYRWVARNRYLFHFNKQCRTNACFFQGSGKK